MTHEAFELFQALALPLALLVIAIAAAVRAVLVLQRPAGFRPGVRRMMATVALLGCWLGVARWWVDHNFATIYAPGYSEGHFRKVRVGMTAGEVEAIMGHPLRRDSTSQRWAPYENWIYSDPPPPGSIGDNYWRRWVMFEGGRVAVIVDDYYED